MDSTVSRLSSATRTVAIGCRFEFATLAALAESAGMPTIGPTCGCAWCAASRPRPAHSRLRPRGRLPARDYATPSLFLVSSPLCDSLPTGCRKFPAGTAVSDQPRTAGPEGQPCRRPLQAASATAVLGRAAACLAVGGAEVIDRVELERLRYASLRDWRSIVIHVVLGVAESRIIWTRGSTRE